MRDGVVDTPSGPIAVRDHGGDGPAILLLHGAGHNLEVWRDVVGTIDGPYRLVSMDLRGHGHSAVVDSLTMADLIDDTHRVCAALQLEDPLLVGHSLGGWVALAAATLGGARGLVSIEGPILAMDRLFRELGLKPDHGVGGEDALRSKAFHGDDAAWETRLNRAGPASSVTRAMAERGRIRLSDGYDHAHPLPAELIAAARCAWEIDPASLYTRLRIPVTVVLGTRQSNVMRAERFVEVRDEAAQALLRNVAGMSIVRVPGGHHLPVERPRDIAEIIAQAAG